MKEKNILEVDNKELEREGIHEAPFAFLKISKLNLQVPLYNFDSSNNQVDKNVTILNESIFPDKAKSHIFFAAHSGETKIAYFRNLDLLEMNDRIIFIYKEKEYHYQIYKREEQPKRGVLEFDKCENHCLSLITCSKINETQIIYYGKLIHTTN